MPALTPKFQTFLDTRNGYVVGITKVTLVSTSDTIILPQFSNTTNSASVSQVLDANEATATVTSVATTGVVTFVGVAGNDVTICSLHPHVNYSST